MMSVSRQVPAGLKSVTSPDLRTHGRRVDPSEWWRPDGRGGEDRRAATAGLRPRRLPGLPPHPLVSVFRAAA